MTPRVTYRAVKNSLRIRIKLQNSDPGVFETGIYVPNHKFDAKKQICGLPQVQNYMNATTEAIRKLYLPDMGPKQLWEALQAQSERSDDSYLIKDAFDYYLRTCTHKSISTVNNVKAVQVKVDMAGLIDLPIKKLNGAVMREFIAKQTNYKESTVYATYIIFKTVINRYVKENGLGFRPQIDGLISLPPKEEDQEPEYLVWDELKKLLELELADPKDSYFRDLWCLMALTGMAVVDLMKFRPEKAISPDGRWFKYTRQKTGNECVSIPLLPAAREIINRNIWPVRISVRTLQYKCDMISDLVGRKIKTHGARKTFGTIMLEFGYSLESVSKFMGHSSPVVTAAVYAHVTQAKVEREMANMPEAIKQMMNQPITK